MKRFTIFAASVALIAAGAASAQAQLLYSFENLVAGKPDGFGPNGGGVTITQTTNGATLGSNALNYSVVQGATFVGALTDQIPAALNSPLAVQQLKVDYTLPASYTGNFASLGVTIFGASQPGPGQAFGLQAQFSDFEALEGKAPGTYTATLDLLSATNPLTFATGQTYNQLFGSGADQLIPTGFQFFLNKDNAASIVFQLDNVRLVQIPEPSSIAAIAGVGGLLTRRRR